MLGLESGRQSLQQQDDEIRGVLGRLIQQTRLRFTGRERRRDVRIPFPYPIQLIPLDDQHRLLTQESFSVIGNHLAERGLDFYHHELVPYRRVVACLPHSEAPRVGLVLDLAWCRFSRYGWYESGGRFLQVVQLPADEESTEEFTSLSRASC